MQFSPSSCFRNSSGYVLINFIGVKFEAGNEKREKVWSGFVAGQNEELTKKSGFWLISLFSRERKTEV